MLCTRLWILCKRFIVFGVRKLKVSQVNSMKTFWFFEHVSLYLTTLLEAALTVVYLIIKPQDLSLISGD